MSPDGLDGRPLPLGEAFRAWSDPDAMRRFDEFQEQSGYGSDWILDLLSFPLLPRDEWGRRVEPLRRRFEAKLKKGELVATGYLQPLSLESQRCEIPAHLFELLRLDYAASEAKRQNLHFLRVEVVPPARGGEPSTSGEVADGAPAPHRAPEGPASFVWNEQHSRVSIRGHEFFLTGGQCTVVRRLHKASMTTEPWAPTKSLLSEAGYSTTTLGGVFRRHKSPSWKELIEQRRGISRLKL